MKSSNFLKFFKAEFKRSLKSIAFIITIGVICFIIPLNLMRIDDNTTNIGLLITLTAILCYIIPIIQNNYKMNKRKTDRVLSLPISKRAIANTKLLVGLLEILISYTFLYIIGFIVVAIRQPHFALQYYIPLYFFILFFTIIVYTLNFFFVSRANNVLDAIILLILWTFSMYVCALLVNQILSFAKTIVENRMQTYLEDINIQTECFIPFVPFIRFGNFYNYWICGDWRHLFETNNPFIELSIVNYILYPLIGIGSYFGILLYASKDKGENAEEITNGLFGYMPIMILYLFWFSVLCCSGAKFTLLAICLAMFLVLEFIHQRKFKLTKVFLIIMIITTIFGSVLGYEIYKTYIVHLDWMCNFW